MWSSSNRFIVVGMRLRVSLPNSSTAYTISLENFRQTRWEEFSDHNTGDTRAHIPHAFLRFTITALRLLSSNVNSRSKYLNTSTRCSSLPYAKHFILSARVESAAVLCCNFRDVIFQQYLEARCVVAHGLTCIPQSLHRG